MKLLSRRAIGKFIAVLLFPIFPLFSSFLLVPGALAAPPGFEAEVTPLTSLSKADRQKIKRVIIAQIKAFERDDAATAFSYSTPEIREQFGSSRTFMEMVRSSYSALYMHASREFLDAAIIDGEVIQPLQIVTRSGETLVALYSLERQPDNNWRIGGCELAPSMLHAT